MLHKRIEKLSGGETQRIGIIRSFIHHPEVVVADEPTAALDEETASKVLDYFKKLKSKGIAIILATHSSFVAEHCDETYLLTKNELSHVNTSEKDRKVGMSK